jgi:hypothetical protein
MTVQSKIGDAAQLAETILPTLRGLCGLGNFGFGGCGKKSATESTKAEALARSTADSWPRRPTVLG